MTRCPRAAFNRIPAAVAVVPNSIAARPRLGAAEDVPPRSRRPTTSAALAPQKPGEFPNSTAPLLPPLLDFHRLPTNPNPSRPRGSTNHHAPRRGFPQPRSKSTHETRAGEFELESSTCDAVEERLDDAEKGAPGGRWGWRRGRREPSAYCREPGFLFFFTFSVFFCIHRPRNSTMRIH